MTRNTTINNDNIDLLKDTFIETLDNITSLSEEIKMGDVSSITDYKSLLEYIFDDDFIDFLYQVTRNYNLEDILCDGLEIARNIAKNTIYEDEEVMKSILEVLIFHAFENNKMEGVINFLRFDIYEYCKN